MSRVRLWVVVSAVLVIGAGLALAFQAVDDDGSGRASACGGRASELSFVSHRAGGRPQVYALNIDRPERVRRLTESSAWTGNPSWSPDGKQFVYQQFSPQSGDVAIYVADADGGSPMRVGEEVAAPSWSPDGRLIAVANLSPRGLGIIDVDKALAGEGSAYRQLTTVPSSVPEEYASWSPDGRQLAFTSHRSGDSDVWVVDVTGENLRNLTHYPGALDDSPSWSPDGKLIAFGSSRDSASQSEGEVTGDIYVMEPDGGEVRRLTAARGGSYGPEWSPDGELIAFNSQRDGNSEVYVMRADGSDQRRLTRHREADGFVAWVGRGCP